jgi:hypothetical protein
VAIPSKEEILANVRQRRLQQAHNRVESNSVNDSRSGDVSSTSSGNTEEEGRRQTPADYRGTGNYQGTEGSDGGIVDEDGRANRDDGRDGSSSYQYHQRPSANYPTTSARPPVAQPVKRSKLDPYKDFFKETFQRKKPTEETSKKPKKTGKVFSESESLKKRGELIEVILLQSENMDNVIQATTKGHNPVYIWSTIDRADAEVLADVMLERARKDPVAAKFVDELLELKLKLQAGVIVGPRAYQTIVTYWTRGFSILW